MSGRAVDVPEAVLQKALAQGAEGRAWSKRLGRLIAELEHDWGVDVGATLHGGSESYVAAARTDAGADAVVKLGMPPYESFAGEVRTLAAATPCSRSVSGPRLANPGCPSRSRWRFFARRCGAPGR